MTDEWIIQKAREAEKRQGFSYLVGSPLSHGVNSPYGAGFIDGMVEYRGSLWHAPSEEPDKEKQILVFEKNHTLRPTWSIFFSEGNTIAWAYIKDIMPSFK